MIEIMNEINNHFIYTSNYGEFEIEIDGLVGNFNDDIIAGMYVIIENSRLNDGIYKVIGVSSTKITVNATLNAETTIIKLYSSTPPKDFIDLVAEINNFSESVGANSESIDDYSISFNGDGSWESAYKKKLVKYRRVYSDLMW